jgi:hypothetical protein
MAVDGEMSGHGAAAGPLAGECARPWLSAPPSSGFAMTPLDPEPEAQRPALAWTSRPVARVTFRAALRRRQAVLTAIGKLEVGPNPSVLSFLFFRVRVWVLSDLKIESALFFFPEI